MKAAITRGMSKLVSIEFLIWLLGGVTTLNGAELKPPLAKYDVRCEVELNTRGFGDLHQRSASIAAALDLDGMYNPNIRSTGLCGPICVVNSLASELNFESASARLAQLKWLVHESEARVPNQRQLSGPYLVYEVGRLLKSMAKAHHKDTEVTYLGMPLPSSNPEDYDDSPMPQLSEIGPPTDISIRDLQAANEKKSIVIALVKINESGRDTISRLSGVGHFVIIEETFTDARDNKTHVLVRDPELDQATWVEAESFSSQSLPIKTIELLGKSGTEWKSKVVVIASLIKAKL